MFIVIGIIILLWLAFRKKPQDGEKCPDGKTPIPKSGICPQSSIDNAQTDQSGCVPPSSYKDWTFPIRKGMKDSSVGNRISDFQHKLNIKYKAGLKEDGFFGCNTQNASIKHLGTAEIFTTNPIWNTPEPVLG